MPKSQFHKCCRLSLAVRIVIVVLAISATPWGAAQESVRCANPIYEAQKFLQALYPETKEKGYTVLYSVGGTYDPAWTHLPRLEVNLLETNYTPSVQLLMGKEGKKYEPLYPLLTAYFYFDKDGRIEEVSIAGDSLANDAKNTRTLQTLGAHHTWSVRQMTRVLKEAGTKYGPEDKESFLASLPITGLAPFLGNLTVKAVDFHLPYGESGSSVTTVDTTFVTEMGWIVQIDAASADGKTQSYILDFEPFAGKLKSLRRRL
jgi:hypothetical protein